MFEAYSERARRVIFLARLEAGARGSDMIDVGDLLTAIIAEDQGKFNEISTAMLHSPGTPADQQVHPAFLPSVEATRLLEIIRQRLPRSQAIATTRDMPISPALDELLAMASDLKEELNNEWVTPLHLLAAGVRQSAKGDSLFAEITITEEQIVKAIRTTP